MKKPLAERVRRAIRAMGEHWAKLEGMYPFVAFSTGKDSLALAAMLYEAVAPERPACVYAHHNMEFPSNLDYLADLEQRGFEISTVHPFLEYFELMDRGIGFLTLRNAWCVPMLVGTGLVDWLRREGARSVAQGVMFRGMSGSEHSHTLHGALEVYRHLNIPCFNPMLEFSTEEIIAIITQRYGLPLNPIYKHMSRTYCICCYTSDKRRQEYSAKHFPEICRRYYGQIESMLFDTDLVKESTVDPTLLSRQEKLERHGFVHWHRSKKQDIVGAIRRRAANGALIYSIRKAEWVSPKHLEPLKGRCSVAGKEVRFWNVEQKQADAAIKRMINCLDCGFCMVECFRARFFCRKTKTLVIEGCVQCGRCLQLRYCMGWQHRFWRRVIVDKDMGNG